MDIENNPLRNYGNVLRDIDPDSIFGKIILNFIDKIVVGILAALIVLLAQGKYEENRRVKEMVFEVTRIQTELIVEHRKKLTSSVDKFISLVIKKDALASGKIENDPDQEELYNFLNEIKVAVFHLQILNAELNIKGKKIVESASKLYVEVTSGSSPEKIQNELERLQNVYSEMLKIINNTTRIIFKNEYNNG